MNRDYSIDIAKGIGIILVVIGHVAVPYAEELYIFIYMFHMPLFFFLSGLFFQRNNFETDIYRKIRSLIVPYFVFAVLGNSSYLLRNLLFGYNIENFSFLYLINAINSPLWFLISLFICFLIYELLSFFKSKWLQLCLSSITSLIGCWLAYLNFRVPFICQALPMLFYYSLGHNFMRWKCGIIYRMCKESKISAICALITLMVCCSVFNKRPNVSTLEFMGHPIAFFFGSIAGIWCCIYISSFIVKRTNKIKLYLIYLGENTLYIMGLHIYIIFHIYFFCIPILMRVFAIMGEEKNGEEIKTFGILNIFIVIITIILSSKLGDIFRCYTPWLFRVTKNEVRCK